MIKFTIFALKRVHTVAWKLDMDIVTCGGGRSGRLPRGEDWSGAEKEV